ncbi:hypothetical protein, partial [Pseudomonas aeruginosa]|uniref:hypothetical protein n=1 Tax=Pseudomonas aeruginosa TaxID=287 RepID=UPI00195523C2
MHQRGLSSAGGLFYFFLRFMGALIFLIGAVRFFNLASPAALLTLVGRNKTPDKPLGAAVAEAECNTVTGLKQV